MNEPQIKRSRIVGVRFTKEEFEKLHEKSRHSTTSQLSEFIRRCVFDKPIVIKHRNQSLDEFMGVLMDLRKELNAIGNNFNQSVRQINTFKEVQAIEHFAQSYGADRDELFNRVERIEERIHQIADLWLQ
jgi:uncharacterized protein YukE